MDKSSKCVLFSLWNLMHVFSFSKGGAKHEIIRKEKHTRRSIWSRGLF